MKRLLLKGAVPCAIIAIFTILEATQALTPLDHRVYDLALGVRPEPPVDPHLLLVPVDDSAIEFSNTIWPWPRDLMAKGLLIMTEFEARGAVFDILYEQRSAPGVNTSLAAGLRQVYERSFTDLKDYFTAIENALLNGDLPLRRLPSAGSEFLSAIDATGRELLDRLSETTYDRDAMLGHAASAFGDAFFAVNLNLEESDAPGKKIGGLPPEIRAKLTVRNLTTADRPAARASDIVLPIEPVLQGARGFGFPIIESQIDQPDGVIRRVKLFYDVAGTPVPQLAFAALLRSLGDPAVEIRSQAVTLKDVLFPGSQTRTDVVIPLTEDGTMLINWTRKRPAESFSSLSFSELLAYDRLEEEMVYHLRLIAAEETSGNLRVTRGPAHVLAEHYEPIAAARDDLLLRGKPFDVSRWRARRAAFAAALAEMVRPEKEAELVRGIAVKDVTERARLEDRIHAACAAVRNDFGKYAGLRERFARLMNGAVCFTSWTATSTTDIGVTPFVAEYENVGTHLSVANTILQRQFLDDVPWWVTALIAAVFTLLVFFFVFVVKEPLVSVFAGAGTVLVETGGLICFFALTGVYPGMVAPVAAALLVFIVFNILNFLSTAKEKNFVRHAFANYVSKEILNELVADPSKLNLGGESKRLTVLFTDIKGFSGFSEKLDPPELVRLLNGYFTDMANIIIGLRGYLDKYVGDAIVSFFGAPTDIERHAQAACLAAVRMKQAETIMNEHLMAERLAPQPLLTRIGINTGEVLVGNMGSTHRINYTVMGHHVNLASRLEGVNKQYGTWILVSENTKREAGESFLFRRLDRVRVVGIEQPVRIYELIGEKSRVRPELFEIVDIFHRALERYEERDWDKARAGFKDVLKLAPEDATSRLYISRCLFYKKKTPAPDWDGVVNLTAK